MKTLIAWSGGIDSTYVLWKELATTQNEVTAFYIDLRNAPNYNRAENINGMHTAELHGLPKNKAWLNANVRHFVQVTIEVNEFQIGDWITPIVIRKGAELLETLGYDQMLTGRSMDNTRTLGQKTQGWYAEMFAARAPGKVLRYPMQEAGQNRAHAMAELPPALLALTVSCARARYEGETLIKCGTCAKCVAERTVLQLSKAGKSPDFICDHLLKMRGGGKYHGKVQPDASFGADYYGWQRQINGKAFNEP